MLYVYEEIGVGRWTVDDGRFSPVGSLMGGEECNQRQMTNKAEEFVPWVLSLAGK